MARTISRNESVMKCGRCSATIAYTQSDVSSGIDEDRDSYSHIVCPNCKRTTNTPVKPLYDSSDYDP